MPAFESEGYLLDPRKMQPKMITQAFVSSNELSGSSSVGCTLAKMLEAGSPPSLAKAHVIRLLVVMILTVAKRRQTRGKLVNGQSYVRSVADVRTYRRSMMDPVRLFVAWKKICNNGPAADLMTSSTGPATSRRTIRKMKPVKVPMPTQAIMMRGPSTVGLGISFPQCLVSVAPRDVRNGGYLRSYGPQHPATISVMSPDRCVDHHTYPVSPRPA